MVTSDKVAAEWNLARGPPAVGACVVESGPLKGEAMAADGSGERGGPTSDDVAAEVEHPSLAGADVPTASGPSGELGYDVDVFNALVARFECPDSRSRWDRPLFAVEATEDVPLLLISEVLLGKANGARNSSTTSQPLQSTSLHDVDRVTQQVVTVRNMSLTAVLASACAF